MLVLALPCVCALCIIAIGLLSTPPQKKYNYDIILIT